VERRFAQPLTRPRADLFSELSLEGDGLLDMEGPKIPKARVLLESVKRRSYSVNGGFAITLRFFQIGEVLPFDPLVVNRHLLLRQR
jgi:hypothetical protein